MTTLTQSIRGNFQGDQTADFRILCSGQVFEVHEVVLREQGFFGGFFNANGNWQEIQSRTLTLDDDPTSFRFLLQHMYGLPYKALSANLRAPLSRLKHVEREHPHNPGKKITLRAIAMPARPNGHQVPYGELSLCENTLRYKDPKPAVSAFHCVELLNLVKLNIIADKYLIHKLASKTDQAFVNLLCDCWNSSAILDVVKFVMSTTGEGSKIRKALEVGLCERADMLVHEPEFRRLVTDCHQIALFFALMERPRCDCKYYSGLVYCGNYLCRKNVQHKLNARGHGDFESARRTCKECKRGDTMSEKRLRLWAKEEGDEAEDGMVDIEEDQAAADDLRFSDEED